MAKSVKLRNDNYLDSSGIVYEKTPLNKILTYSYDEQVIGTWATGKPLYRRIIRGTVPTLNGNWQNVVSIDAGLVIKKFEGTLSGYAPIPRYSNPNYYLDIQYLNGYLQIMGAGYSGQAFDLIIEYTKTTD